MAGTGRFEQTRGVGTARAWIASDVMSVVEILHSDLTREGFEVTCGAPGGHAILPRGFEPDLIVVHHVLPRLDGISLLARVRERSSAPVVIVASGASIADCEQAMRLGADRFLVEADIDQFKTICRDWMRGGHEGPQTTRPRVWTAADARIRRDQELRDRLLDLLSATNGNIAEMARRIGKDRSTVRYHLRRFGMLEQIPYRNEGGPEIHDSEGGRCLSDVGGDRSRSR